MKKYSEQELKKISDKKIRKWSSFIC